MRKLITSILAIIILGGAIYMAKRIIDSRKPPVQIERKIVSTVFVDTVRNGNVPIIITTSGNLRAKYRTELYAEVQGIFDYSAGEFKPGVRYDKGSTLIRINSDEHRSNLLAQKSNLYNQIVLFIPDLRLDYPESFPAWDKYVRNFDVEKSLVPLPVPISEKEKLFVSGRNIYTSYYNVKTLEERLIKYTMRAPFYGVLTDALVTPGTLVRAGQKLGEYINPDVYELEVPINASYSDLLKVGQTVVLNNIERTKTWDGKVIRVNSRVEQSSQSVPVFILVKGADLKEGMYLEADLNAREIESAYEISRKLLVEDKKVFYVNDSVLLVKTIDPIYFKESSVVVQGLEDGLRILAKAVPGAHAGMQVKVMNN